MRWIPYLAFVISFLVLVFLIYIAGILHSLVLVYLPSFLRAICYSVLVVIIVAVWSFFTYRLFREVERRGLNISQDNR
ncbi:MAG: hypothetical protein GXO23_03470 [Crenarchaeota archaeon]|nr:hypothetical protein [Thermoproteota archaeon]